MQSCLEPANSLQRPTSTISEPQRCTAQPAHCPEQARPVSSSTELPHGRTDPRNPNMTIFDALLGRKSSSQSPSSASASSPSAPTTTHDAPHSSPFQPSPYDPSVAQGVDAFLGTSSFADPTQLHPLAGLNQETLEYISLEDSTLSDLPGAQGVVPTRGFTDDLCYGTGVTYLAGLSLGGAWGLQEGLRRSSGQPPKLRLNSVLNAITRRGPFLGNSAGVVAICYNLMNSYFGYVRGKHDAANTIAAGALSGMLFKSTRGLRPMVISGGIVASVAGAWAVSPFPNAQVAGYLRLTINRLRETCLHQRTSTTHRNTPLLEAWPLQHK